MSPPATSISTRSRREARQWPGLVGMDLVPMVTSGQRFTWDETPWQWDKAATASCASRNSTSSPSTTASSATFCASSPAIGCKVTVVPAQTVGRRHSRAQARRHIPLQRPGRSGGDRRICRAGDPQADRRGMPTFGICLGHQMLGIAVGGKTMKMHQGHHGANHPVKDLTTGKVEITSMNHGFAVDRATACRTTSRRPMCRCSTAPIAASRSRTGRCSRSSITPRPRPARATATDCSRALST